ncbi:hypothetical protein WICPIJ_002864 [Wickerhamomyces pijperi]|uniref:Uncharacterized protein n=1 Tax=Wickerhamomyces pijperi TaxID=599730 RepID=A0A9P8QAW8_WICPI|nr:hypothetical protein WICPIJ_002864 [Wickerhamomyces pijperi]
MVRGEHQKLGRWRVLRYPLRNGVVIFVGVGFKIFRRNVQKVQSRLSCEEVVLVNDFDFLICQFVNEIDEAFVVFIEQLFELFQSSEFKFSVLSLFTRDGLHGFGELCRGTLDQSQVLQDQLVIYNLHISDWVHINFNVDDLFIVEPSDNMEDPVCVLDICEKLVP